MANTSSARKAIRSSLRKRMVNKPIRTGIRTQLKKARAAVVANTGDPASSVMEAVSTLDKAAHKNVIHPNKAARLKSRLMRKLNQATAAS